MAETDHGELLTKFEEIFGCLVEHEVIKMVLQSCDWHSSSASEMILGMIDKDQLPAHIRNAVAADAIIRGGSSSNVLPGSSVSQLDRFDDEEVTADQNSFLESVYSEAPEVSKSASQSRSGSGSPACSLFSESRGKDSNGPSSGRPYSHNSVMTPFAMAQGAISKEPYLSNELPQRPWPALQNSPARRDEEKGGRSGFLAELDGLSDRESDTSLPHSPVKATAPELDFDTNRAQDTAHWVLAPEFVPNRVRSTNGGIWPIGAKYGFTAVNQDFTLPSSTSRPSEHQVQSKPSKKEEIVNKILSGEKMMILMRGLPGSGKSSLAREVKGHSGVILSTDDYFNDKQGRYFHQPNKLPEAHTWNRNRARLKLREKRSPIIIDNTNLQIWEMKPYVKLALQNGYEVDILEPETSWKVSVKELAKRNVHGVPKEKIREMKDRYDPSIKIEYVIASMDDKGLVIDPRTRETVDTEVSKEKLPCGKTDWPTTLPEPMANGKSPTGNGEEAANGKSPTGNGEEDATFLRNGSNIEHDTSDDILIPTHDEPTQNVPDDATSRVEDCNPGNVLSYLELYESADSEDDDADVVIEGYEDMEVGDYGASETLKVSDAGKCGASEHVKYKSGESHCIHKMDSEDSTDTELREGLSETVSSNINKITELQMQENVHLPSSKDIEEEISQTSFRKVDNVAVLENTQIHDEEKIKILLEEANLEVDDEHVEDWDDLVINSSEEELNEETFNELVKDLGTSVKCELEKKFQGNGDNVSMVNANEEDFPEDSAMYDFCTSMEDKIGRSLSSVITRPNGIDEPSSLFCVINADSLEGSSSHNSSGVDEIPELPEAIVSQTAEVCNVISDKNDNVMSSNCEEKLISHTVLTAENSPVADSRDRRIDSDSEEKNEHEERELSDGVEEENLVEVHQESIKAKVISENTNKTVTPDLKNDTRESSDPCKSEISVDKCPSSLALASWECVDTNDGESSVNWDPSEENDGEVDEKKPKPTRDRRGRILGDPKKYLLSEKEDAAIEDPNSCSWEPVSEGAVASWDDTTLTKDGSSMVRDRKSGSHTGAVPKMRNIDIKHSSSVASMGSYDSSSDKMRGKSNWASLALSKSAPVDTIKSAHCIDLTPSKLKTDAETQTLSIDFQALDLDNNLYEQKILYGQPNYVPVCSGEGMLLENGPLTKGKLSLDKGIMTDSESSEVSTVKPLHNLVAFFPKIPEAELKDVLEKCKYDLDWTMNVLLDGGYEMADSVDVCNSQEGSEVEIEDIEPTLEPANSTTVECERLTASEYSDMVMDVQSEEKTKRLKQSQQPDDLVCKQEIENTFAFSGTVDDRVTRLTGKDFDNLNLNKVKKNKAKKKHSKKKHSEASTSSAKEAISWEEGEGAQYITLMMDPLFASQLVSMYGPIGSCGMSGDMAPEDRSVILPLELCHQIHKYWTKTLDGKFNHEAEVLDSLIRDDENLARRLQEEEEKASKNGNYVPVNSSSLDNSEKAFQLDPPTNFKEIMDLEQALLQSQRDKTSGNGSSLSSSLFLKRLYEEYPDVDRDALKLEFTESGSNYEETVKRISNRYASDPGAPKTVVAPEFLQQYEQQMIQKAKELSLAEQEREEEEQNDDEELQPDNPQVYRDEAQTHYHQRQEYYRKAQEAHRQGMKAVAAYYASIGKLHSEKLNEANQRASVKILEAVNSQRDANALDLHLLHVPEALTAAQAFLSEREQLLTSRNINQMHVSLITGRGAHSVGGQARLKPAVKDFLSKKGYLFHEANSGMFIITLQR